MSRVHILVTVAGAHDIVAAGLRALLEEDPNIEILDQAPFGVVPDVVLCDAIALEEDGGIALNRLVKVHGPRVVVIARDLRPDLAARALAHGAVGFFSLESEQQEILATVHATVEGQLPSGAVPPLVPGAEAGLTSRETDVLTAITKGFRNQDIAAMLDLSPNSIKSYIRSAYRKIGVSSRSQAVAWCLLHGFQPPDG